jgi:hypothetical protein
MLTADKVVAVAPRNVTKGPVECANKCIPPKAVVPEIAFVTAIKGECKECETPKTTWTPMMLLKAKVVNIEENAALGATAPMAKIEVESNAAFLAPAKKGAL